MRQFNIFITLLISISCFSQAKNTTETILDDSGKNEFKSQLRKDTPDYKKAFEILTDQVKLNPNNAEYRYYLGYTIDRLNAIDGKEMFQLKKEMTIKASEQFEEVNRLEPIYKGEYFLLDPYTKLTSIWGSLAQAYLNLKLIDSANWAFSEGKKRGGFIEPILEFNRQLLNSCDKNAILITYGDLVTIPTWYLQVIENYRTDVTVVDANLINTNWYPKYLKSQRNLKLGFTDSEIDTINYQYWDPKIVTITNQFDPLETFSWELRATYMEKYILKGDRILLDIFQQNLFERPIYFSNNSDSTYNLFLLPYMADEGLVDRVVREKIDWTTNVVTIHKNLYQYNIDKLQLEDIVKSRDAVIVLNGFRWSYFNNIYNLATQGNYDKAKELIKLMDDKFRKDKLPFTSSENEKYFRDVFIQVDKNYR